MPTLYPSQKILITCPKHLAGFLAREVEALGLPVTGEFVTGVETEGGMPEAMMLNLHLRTGYHVLYHLHDFTAATPDDLYDEVRKLPWESYIPVSGYLSVNSSVQNQAIRDTRFANMRCKDAVVDRITDRKGRRPDSGPDMRGAVIFLRWQGEDCSLYLDTSGEPLTRRGYRKLPFKAPMQEALAAAVVSATDWDGEGAFVNPMCGSGTLAIEAALKALGRAPGIYRTNFAFMHLEEFDRRAWTEMRNQARREALKRIPGRVIATDINPEAVEAARKNAATAGLDHLIEFSVCDFADTPVPDGGGVVVLNPEYGERLGRISELEDLYARIGDFFKQRCAGYFGYVFTGNLKLAKRIGLRTKRRIPFYNGSIDCRLLEYELYEGSRKGERDDSATAE